MVHLQGLTHIRDLQTLNPILQIILDIDLEPRWLQSGTFDKSPLISTRWSYQKVELDLDGRHCIFSRDDAKNRHSNDAADYTFLLNWREIQICALNCFDLESVGRMIISVMILTTLLCYWRSTNLPQNCISSANVYVAILFIHIVVTWVNCRARKFKHAQDLRKNRPVAALHHPDLEWKI